MKYKNIVDHVDYDHIARDRLGNAVYYESPHDGTRYSMTGDTISYQDSMGRRVDFNGDPTYEDD